VTRSRSTSFFGSSSVRALAVVVAVAALGLSGCSSSSSAISGDALVVNGTSLSNKQFQTQLSEIQADPNYVKIALAGQKGQTLTTTTTPNNYSTAFTTQVLNQQVTFALAAQEVAKRSLTVSDDDRAKAQQVLANDLSGQTTDPQTGQKTSDGAGQKTLDDLGSFKNTLIEGVANILAIQKQLTTELSTDDALKTAFAAGGKSYQNQACVSVIIIDGRVQDPTTGGFAAPTAASSAAALTKAQALVPKIANVTDFATVAQASSDDKTTGANGGDLGCAPVGSYAQQQPEVDAAIAAQPVGTVGVPIKTSFGYALLLVRSRGDLTFEQAKPQLTSGVATAMKAAFKDWINTAAQAAEVVVDPQWGSWDKAAGTVVAAGGATSTTSTTSTEDPNASTTTSLSPEQLQQLLGNANGATSSSSP
jgi:hypothetical protein